MFEHLGEYAPEMTALLAGNMRAWGGFARSRGFLGGFKGLDRSAGRKDVLDLVHGRNLVNLVECWFAEIANQRIPRGVFRSVQELETAIREYIEAHNDAADLKQGGKARWPFNEGAAVSAASRKRLCRRAWFASQPRRCLTPDASIQCTYFRDEH